MEEGYIKFKRTKVDDIAVPSDHLAEITTWRDKLYSLGLIGEYLDGVGFGNVSIRHENRGLPALFIITGSKTGGLKTLTNQHYARVIDVDVDENHVSYGGPIEASSESMTHAMVYRADPTANAVIHVHNPNMWKELMGKVPTTSKGVQYGTPEMAKEMLRLFKETDVKEKKILVMAGHEEGVLSFGKSLEEAGNVLLDYFENNEAK